MVKQTKSRWEPQNPHWAEDLPARAAPEQVAPGLFGDLNAIDDTMLEISRASSIMTGVMLFFAGLGAGIILFFLIDAFLWSFNSSNKKFDFTFFIFFFMSLPAFFAFFIFARIEFVVPRDRPIRFNRKNKKVYVYEYPWSWNPLSLSQVVIKTFDWDTIGAELTRQRGFNGKAYIERWALGLVSCRPGTNEVVDRFELKGNRVTTAELYRMWEYCRHYMEKGCDGLPEYAPRHQEISFRRCFFRDVEFLESGPIGKEARRTLSSAMWVLNIVVLLAGFWIIFPSNICYYIVSRFAPEVKWPPALDAESRGLSISGSDEENPTDVASDN